MLAGKNARRKFFHYFRFVLVKLVKFSLTELYFVRNNLHWDKDC